MKKPALVTVALLVVVGLMGLRAAADGSASFDSPISPLPTSVPPPAVCGVELNCQGSPARAQACIGRVVQDEGRAVLVEVVSGFLAPYYGPQSYVGAGVYEWTFKVAFGSVPCWLGKPYAKLYLKAIDIPHLQYGHICQEIWLETHCTTLPYLASQD